MKKTICLLLTGLGVAVAWGDAYLYWMIDVDQTKEALGDNWAAGATVQLKSIDSQGQIGDALLLSYGDGTVIGSSMSYAETMNVADYVGVGVYASLAQAAGDGWSYIVELYNSQSEQIGFSEAILYTDAIAGHYVANFSGGALDPVALWMPAVSVPEPTSAMLVLFGCALLGLKRRKSVA